MTLDEALSHSGISPLERVLLVHAVHSPGAYSVRSLASANVVSDAAIGAAVKHLGKKKLIRQARPLDGFVNLEPA